jgi:hypothetical protein
MLHALLRDCSAVARCLRRNYDGYFDRYPLLITITVIAAMADFISTVHFMHHDGIHHELHPGIRMAAEELGIVAGAFIGKIVQLAALFLVTLYLRSITRLLFVAATMMYGWAAWYNVWGHHHYTPLLIYYLPQ